MRHLYQLNAKIGETEMRYVAIFDTLEAAMERVEKLRNNICISVESAYVWILTKKGHEYECDLLDESQRIKVV